MWAHVKVVSDDFVGIIQIGADTSVYGVACRKVVEISGGMAMVTGGLHMLDVRMNYDNVWKTNRSWDTVCQKNNLSSKDSGSTW